MSFINVHYEHRASTMHVWEEINGEKFYDRVTWTPYVYIPDMAGDTITIDGRKTSKKTFYHYHQYYKFCEDNKNIYENRVRPEIQFLAERYYKIPDDELQVPKLRIYTIDIEVDPSNGFPDIDKAEDAITLVSVMDSITKHIVTFGLFDYTPKEDSSKNVHYRKCKNEIDLLKRLFDFLHKRPADVFTGWNCYGFDIPYIINRTKTLLGEKTKEYCKMSPANIVNMWHSKSGHLNVDIAGVHILDYMDIYKWYAPDKLEKYSLDFVAKHELEKGKLDYSEYKDFKELYKDWDTFVDYNVIDCKRVDQLEDKKGYIRLIQALSLLTKCPMKYYQAMTSLIEGALLTYFRRNNMCAPYFAGGTQETFPAAHVKEPKAGMYEWVIDIDIASSYPSHIIALNMSNETYFGRIVAIPENQIIEYVRKREFPTFSMRKDKMIYFEGETLKKFNAALKKGLFAIAPCGSVFKTNKTGVIADIERKIFFKRKEIKNKMKEYRNIATELEGDEKKKAEDKEKELFSLQWAIKILLNAMFGITSVPYSRYFNVNIAEAITSCGRWTIKQGEKFVNEYFKNLGYDDEFVLYIDTDSLFVNLGEYMKKTITEWDDLDDSDKIIKILDLAEGLENYVNKRTFEETQLKDYNSQVKDYKIMFEQEIVAKTALFVKKKKYSYWIVNKEGTPSDKLEVKGLEIVRSDSAEAIRTRLKHVYELIMKNTSDDEIIKTIQQYKNELINVSPEEIAANIGINNINRYTGGGDVMKGTPWHVKGANNYRIMLKKLNLTNKYEDLMEGAKAKVVYLKTNNFNMETMAFNFWPKEFDEYFQIDYDKMIKKFFLKKVGFLLDPMNKKYIVDMKKSEGVFGNFFG